MGLLLRLAARRALRDPDPSGEAVELAARTAAVVSGIGIADGGAFFTASLVLIAADRLDLAIASADAAVAAAHRHGRLLDLGIAAAERAHVQYRRGRLHDAEADARLADRLGRGFDVQVRRQTLAWVLLCLVERGAEARGRAGAGGERGAGHEPAPAGRAGQAAAGPGPARRGADRPARVWTAVGAPGGAAPELRAVAGVERGGAAPAGPDGRGGRAGGRGRVGGAPVLLGARRGDGAAGLRAGRRVGRHAGGGGDRARPGPGAAGAGTRARRPRRRAAPGQPSRRGQGAAVGGAPGGARVRRATAGGPPHASSWPPRACTPAAPP